MILLIGDKWRIRSDRYQWHLERNASRTNRKTGASSKSWGDTTFHRTRRDALYAIVEFEARESIAEQRYPTVADALSKLP